MSKAITPSERLSLFFYPIILVVFVVVVVVVIIIVVVRHVESFTDCTHLAGIQLVGSYVDPLYFDLAIAHH